MALSKIVRDSLNTGIDDNSDATAITIDSSENVLIGDASPQVTSKLTVSGNGSADTGTFMYDGTAGTYLDINTNAANGIISLEANARSGNYPPLTFITSGSERLRIQAGGGISFNGDTASANALDDYEYGVFDPDIEASGTAYTSRTIASRGGYYEKVGNAVSVYVYFELSAWTLGSASGSLLITGMPFAPSTARAGTGGGGGVAFHGLNTGGSGGDANNTFNVMPYVNSASKIVFLTSRDSTSWANVPISDVHIGTIFAVWCQINYYTA